MNFNCPSCGRELQASGGGFSGNCPGCGAAWSVTAEELTSDAPPRRDVSLGRQGYYAGLVLFLCAILGGGCIGAIALVSWLFHDPDRVHRQACETHLRSIASALDMYHQDYGNFPPAWIVDAAGKPMHSWRVLILPELGEDELYAQYKFDEPWDGPNNSKLIESIPEVYRCSNDPEAFEGHTTYLAVVGPQAAWLGAQPVKLSLLANPGSAIQVIEASESGIKWLEPRDFTIPTTMPSINSSASQGIRSLHLNGAHVLYADGKVEFLSNDTSATLLTQRLTAPRVAIQPAADKTPPQVEAEEQ